MTLIEYKPQFFTFEETLILGEAARRMDFARYNQIVTNAIIRSFMIPSRLLSEAAESANYSSSRLDAQTYRT